MRNIIVILGILIALIPFLGFPGIVEDVFFIVAGLVIALAAYYGGISDHGHEVYNNHTTHNMENNEVKKIHSDNI